MRAKRSYQLPLTVDLGEHHHIEELREISRVLDKNPEILDIVHSDLVGDLHTKRGPNALSAEQVVRIGVLYQMHRWTFRESAFEVQFNEAYRSFCRLRFGQSPSKSALQRDINRIGPDSWEQINQILIGYAIAAGIEDGNAVRTDCTVMESPIHAPTDSSLLWDSVRKLTDLLDDASDIVEVSYTNHRKVAKRRAFAILNAKRMEKRIPLYLELLKVTKKTIGYAKKTVAALRMSKHLYAACHAELIRHFVVLAEKVVDQTERRIVHGESVPAEDKIVSIFEEHTKPSGHPSLKKSGHPSNADCKSQC